MNIPEVPAAVGKVWASKIEVWPIDRFVLYGKNPRKHNDQIIDRMAESLKEYGFPIPVLCRKNTGEVIDGHLRLKGARRAGLTEAPFINCDGWTDAQIKSFRLLANRSVNWAEWDYELLQGELGDLKDLEYNLGLTGFEDWEINPILGADWEPESPDGNLQGFVKHALAIAFTEEQRIIINQAIAQVRSQEHDPKIPEGRCLELICADYLAGLMRSIDKSETCVSS